MKKRIIAVTLTCVLGLSMLAGCGKTVSDYDRYSACATIGSYEGLEYVPASRELADDAVQNKIDQFCNQNSVKSEDKESAIKSGDVVNINYVKTVDGEEVSSETSDDGYELTIGNNVLGDGFDDQLVGVKPGESKTVTVTYAEDNADTTLAGKTAEFKVDVNYISVTTIPEYTNELVNKATDGEYTTTEAYTQYLTEQATDEKNREADNADRSSVLKELIANTTFTKYPEDEVKSYMNSIMSNLESTASQYGIGIETYAGYMGYNNEADFLDYLYTSVENVMQEKIVVTIIAEKEGLNATDDDLAAYKQSLADDYSVEVSDIETYYSDSDLRFYTTEKKVLDYLVSKGKQVESTEESSEAATETGDTDEATSETETASETEAASETDTVQ